MTPTTGHDHSTERARSTDGAVVRRDVALVVANAVRGDGQGRAMVELARALVARGHTVTVYAHRLDDQLAASVRFRHILRVPGPSTLDNLVMLATNTRRIRRAGHDVACVLGPTALPSCPYVFYAQFSHRGWRATWTHDTQPRLRNRLHSRLMAVLETVCVRRARRLVATTPVLAREILGDLRVPFEVVPNGVAAEEFPVVGQHERQRERRRFGLPDGSFVVAFLGEYVTPRKGLAPLLEAIALSAHDDERLLVAGQGDRDAVQARARELGLGDRVVVAGFESPARIMAAADAVAVPSSYEPFSLVAFEAAAARIPVVISGVAGAAHLLRDAAVVVDDVRDPYQLRRALDRVRSDPAVAHSMAQSARRIVESMGWERLMEGAAVVIEEVATVGYAERASRTGPAA